MPIKLTPEQVHAVEQKGNILVAAAAGSGKTAVLVERVINKLCSKTEPVSADRLLIVTFTNAAANEMRSRIERRLDEECRNNPEDTGLLMQKHLLSSAKICTIDSFCIDLVRENFEKAGVSPDFTIADGHTLNTINIRVITEIVNELLETKNTTFLELLDIIGAEFDEKKFIDFVLEIYEYSRQMPFPEKWFKSLTEFYGSGEFKTNNPWRQYAINRAIDTVKAYQESMANAIDLVAVNEKAADKYLPFFMAAAEKLNDISEICNTKDWDAIATEVNEFFIPTLPRVNGVSDILEIKSAKDIYDRLRTKGFESLAKLFYADSDFINQQFEKIAQPLELLTDILIDFDHRVFSAYCEENIFTFHNTEHMALNFLCEENDGIVTVKSGAEEFLDRYDEVCVDEYQDTNDLQNMLFYVLSNRDTKLFAVGDVKQSIYGFRGANPGHFLEKQRNHIPVAKALDNDPKKIILGNNFRCKPEVCDFINFFFELFMNKDTGEIEYNNEEKLIASAKYPNTDISAVSMDIIDSFSDEQSDKILEARQIASFIHETMSRKNIIRKDDETLRDPKFSDFTILLRSVKNNAGIISAELKKQGIPVNYNVDGFLEFTEIAVMISLLKVIDNPCSDVELLSVMMSPIFGFTAEEMSQLRIAKKDGDLYSAISFAAQNGNKKVEDFLNTLQKFRLFAVTNTLPLFIDYLIEETGFMDTVSAYGEGSRRKNNLLLLCDYAKQYSTGIGTNISGFVNYIVKQNENSIKSAVADSGEDTVKIMSIHASKGLQFPICIIAGTSGGFNNSESRENTIYSTDFGIGFKYFDETDKKRYTTIGREAILDRIKGSRLEEELRLLYVAMTRTQDILHFSAVTSNIDKKIGEAASLLLANNCKITTQLFSNTRSYFEWLMLAIMLHQNCKTLRGSGSSIIAKETNSEIKVNLINSDEILNRQNLESDENIIPNESVTLELIKNMEYEYPFKDLLSIESKASVSVIANKAESEKYAFSAQPSFMSDGGITATQKGTAMHKVMEFFDFSKWENPDEELERLYEWQFLSEREYESVNTTALKKFFESEIFKRILKADIVKREMRFLTELPANRLDNSLDEKFSQETVIVQGAVDVCFVEEDGVVILDFKTDRTESPDALREAYGEQLRIYAAACEKIFKKPVKEMKIYSFFQTKEINV